MCLILKILRYVKCSDFPGVNELNHLFVVILPIPAVWQIAALRHDSVLPSTTLLINAPNKGNQSIKSQSRLMSGNFLRQICLFEYLVFQLHSVHPAILGFEHL